MPYFALNNRLEQVFKEENTSSEVRDSILETARDLFIKNGFNGTSVREIATASDTNVAMVNYYFRSKYNLFEIIFEESLDVLTERIFETLTSDLPFFELLEAWINTYYDILMEYPQIPIFILNEISLDPERLAKRFINRSTKGIGVFWHVSNRIEEEVKKGTIRETPSIDFLLNVLSLCVFPFIFGKLVVVLTDNSAEEYKELLEQHKAYVVQFVTNALKPCGYTISDN